MIDEAPPLRSECLKKANKRRTVVRTPDCKRYDSWVSNLVGFVLTSAHESKKAKTSDRPNGTGKARWRHGHGTNTQRREHPQRGRSSKLTAPKTWHKMDANRSILIHNADGTFYERTTRSSWKFVSKKSVWNPYSRSFDTPAKLLTGNNPCFFLLVMGNSTELSRCMRY